MSRLSSFLTLIVMPLTYSITDGIGAGFVAYTLLQVAAGRARQLHWLMILSSLLFLLYFAIDPLSNWLGLTGG